MNLPGGALAAACGTYAKRVARLGLSASAFIGQMRRRESRFDSVLPRHVHGYRIVCSGGYARDRYS